MQNNYDNNQRESVTYAGFWVRAAAYLLDSIVVFAGLLVVRLLMSFVMARLQGTILGGNILFHYTLKDIALYACQVLYFILCTYCTGTTLGKRALNLRVVNAGEEDRPSLTDIVYRETVGRFLCSLPIGIGYLIAGLDKEKRGIHDMLCDTRVVYTKKVPVYPVYQPVMGNMPMPGNMPQPADAPMPGSVPQPADEPMPGSMPQSVDVPGEGSTTAEGDMYASGNIPVQGVPLTTPWASQSGPYHLVREEEASEENRSEENHSEEADFGMEHSEEAEKDRTDSE